MHEFGTAPDGEPICSDAQPYEYVLSSKGLEIKGSYRFDPGSLIMVGIEHDGQVYEVTAVVAECDPLCLEDNFFALTLAFLDEVVFEFSNQPSEHRPRVVLSA